jgi:hypothetical protein
MGGNRLRRSKIRADTGTDSLSWATRYLMHPSGGRVLVRGGMPGPLVDVGTIYAYVAKYH